MAHVALVRRRLRERLAAAAGAVGTPMHDGSPDDAEAAARIVLDLVARAVAVDDPAVLWITWVAVSTTFPTRDEVEYLVGAAARAPDDAATWLVDRGITQGQRSGNLSLGLVVASSSVVIDASYSATNDHNSGIQRVVRSASRVWADEQDVVLAASAGPSGALRTLTPGEFARTARWGVDAGKAGGGDPSIIVPWRGSVVFPEVPDPQRIEGLIGLARYSGNATVAIGHDAIPVTGREFVSARETAKFSRFLGLLAELGTVIAVSETAAADFRGLSETFAARGGRAAVVEAVTLPIMVDPRVPNEPEGMPLVLVVGSKEPRKNQDAVIYAAEVLWREGLRFELLLLGAYGWSTRRFRSWLGVAKRAGRMISAPRSSSDRDIWAAYDRAAFTVFPSFQEGFGLPVAESLSRGVPAITSDYGSMAEVARGGGCVTIDSYDDGSLIAAMRELLTSPARIAALRDEVRARPADSWERYARDVLQIVRGAR